MLTFPTAIEPPNIPDAANSGSSFTKTMTDSTISTTTDAIYKKTRPRTSRVIRAWTFSWVGLSEDDFALIDAFWQSVRTSDEFSWTNWIDNKTYVVRFTGANSWQYRHPYGWQGSFTFEEV